MISGVAGMPMFLVKADGSISAINQAFTKLLGYRAKDVVGESIAVLRHSFFLRDDQKSKKKFSFQLSHLSLSENRPMIMLLNNKAERSDPLRIRSVVERGPGNRINEMACIIEKPANLLHETAAEKEDIEKTDKWKIEQIYRNILENSGDAILIADLNVRVVTVNRATLQMLDFETEDELLGKFLFELGPSEGIFTSTTGEVITFDKTWLDMQVNIPNTLFKKGTVNCEIYLLKKDGTIVPVEATLSLLQNRVGDIIGSISICRDITERRVARQKLQQAHEDLEKKVQERTHNLEEVNTALQVLLRNREKDQKFFEKKILFNVEKLILPYLESLKKCCSENRQKTFLRILETNIKEMIAPYAHQLSTKYLKLTPTEIQVANFIRQGQSTKEIAETLSLSAKTIATHRRNIRVKLGLKNQKANLRSSLQAIQ